MPPLARPAHLIVTFTPPDAIPFATTLNLLAPVSALGGTTNEHDTILLPVATAIVLKL